VILVASDGAAVVVARATGKVVRVENPASAKHLAVAPGSAIKPFVLAALLQSGKLSAKEKFQCPGTLIIDGHNLTCAHPHMAAALGVEEAIAYSCNNFVAHFASRFGDGELARYLALYGFASVQAVSGDGRKMLQALGETGLEVTALEMARAYRKLAGEGPPEVLAGLRGAVEYGTAQLASVDGVPLWGKTGTAISHGLHLAWFAGFTPTEAIAVVKQGRAGGVDAAPVARTILESLHPPGPGVVTVRQRRIRLEDYVAAVLAGETKDLHSPEALKAMAVAARTFAVRFRGRHRSEGFDFCDNTHCQNVRFDAVTAKERDAVAATAGELLWYQGSAASTYYSKDCGGVTEAAGAVWPDMAALYLRSVGDHFCPRQTWDSSVRFEDFHRALRAAGLNAPERGRSIAIADRTESGRALKLAIAGDGPPVLLPASAVRFALGRTLGWSAVRSDLYEVRLQGGTVLFHGRGTGHGVGLCQLGADAMGHAGKSFREILAAYYPGTVPGLTAQGLEWRHLGGERVGVFSTQPGKDAPVVARGDALLRGAEEQTGFHLDGRPMIRIYPSIATFRDSTGEPGWVAGDARGRLIRLQPGFTTQTMHHELLHVLIESKAVGSLPTWFREELVEYLARDGQRTSRVASLVARYGKPAVLGWVTRGLPPELRNISATQAASKIK
jgi:stage II sporulation protein D